MNMQCIENQNLGSIDMKKYIYEKQFIDIRYNISKNYNILLLNSLGMLPKNDIYHLFNDIMSGLITYPMTCQINTAINK